MHVSNMYAVQADQVYALLKSTSVKKACRKSIRDQKFGVGAIFKILYETFDIKKIYGALKYS